MYDIRQIIQRLRSGETNRGVARAQRVGRNTVANVRDIAVKQNWLDAARPMPDDTTITMHYKSHRKNAIKNPRNISTVAPFREEILAWHMQGVQASSMRQALESKHGYTGSVHALYRFIRREAAVVPPATVILDFAVGMKLPLTYLTPAFLSSLQRESDSGNSTGIAERCLGKLDVLQAPPIHAAQARQRWMEWLYLVERQELTDEPDGRLEQRRLLLKMLTPTSHTQRKKALVILANGAGFSASEIAAFLAVSRSSVRKYLRDFRSGGTSSLLSRKAKARKATDADFRGAVFGLLHEPPPASGINRTTWKLVDLRRMLKQRGYPACSGVIRSVIRDAGYRWKSARVVLTSTDPEYREKLSHIQEILANLKGDERFFSIDEYGPFAVKMKAGRVLVAPGVQPTVPQWQKSKGCLILTAALELSTNQVTHFYSKAKNTDEMMRMVKILTEEYKDVRRLYLSWDAASWHISKKMAGFIEEHNETAADEHQPILELAPLPKRAQFLNVIESVFSGMARAIIHSSDYQSVDAVMEAIDRYFAERNRHFKDNPKRAGKKLWGMERSNSKFAADNNCKDPAYR